METNVNLLYGIVSAGLLFTLFSCTIVVLVKEQRCQNRQSRAREAELMERLKEKRDCIGSLRAANVKLRKALSKGLSSQHEAFE